MTDKEILQGIDKLEDGIPFDEIRNGDKWLDIHELFSEIKERIRIWHYPSKGEYPPLLEYVLCKLTDDTYEVGYYQGQIDGEPEWAFTCFLGDVVAWQYIEPPKEEA